MTVYTDWHDGEHYLYHRTIHCPKHGAMTIRTNDPEQAQKCCRCDYVEPKEKTNG